MTHYIDGFVFPIARDHVPQYKQVAEAIAEIYKEHGALNYLEYIGDELQREGTRSFGEIAAPQEGEVIIFGWAFYDSKESRDRVNAKVEQDPRMPDLVGPLMDPANPIFDPSRMLFGGFQSLIGNAAADSAS